MKHCVKYPDDKAYISQASLLTEEVTRRIEHRTIVKHKRRATKLGRPATITVDQWLLTLQYFQGRCAYCQDRIYRVFEHFISLSDGGGTTFDNCVPACQSCNVIKTQRGLNPETTSRVQAYLATCRSEA